MINEEKKVEETTEPKTDANTVLAYSFKEQLEWFEHPKEPFLNTPVVAIFDDGKNGIAQLDDTPNRKCWLIQGTGKMFWRSMVRNVSKWRWMTSDEMVEYHLNRTLAL